MPDVSILDQTDEVNQIMKDDGSSNEGDLDRADSGDMREAKAIVIDKVDSLPVSKQEDGRNTPGFNGKDADNDSVLKQSHEKRMDQLFELANDDDDNESGLE